MLTIISQNLSKIKALQWLYVLAIGLTQWGSKALGDQGYSPIEILRYYYGDNMYINTAQEISGVPSSWPGYTLSNGSSGDKVRQMQEQLNVIAGAYPAIPKLLWTASMNRDCCLCAKIQSVFGLLKREQSIIAHGIKSPKFT